MFGLLAGFYQYLFKKTEFYVLIIGLDHAGKTTLLEQMKADFKGVEPLSPDQIMPTVGLNIGRVEVRNAKLIFWDLGGQSELRTIWDKYYSEVQGIIFVLDSADSTRFSEAQSELDTLLRHQALKQVPLLFFANKQDLESIHNINDIKTTFNMKEIERTRDFKLQPLTAITGAGITEGIEWLIKSLEKAPKRENNS
eukprot:TRINITY_DN7788_c0_g1_i2.p1 TRINITY_DN7788_c0_g1~~TRINITY_DN7788_c0_g1_i2.p1  ORF type:complete len:196 (+),score=38.20 TRINITY_DN7788_c0_g1_i2:125-712(+)